MGQAHLVGPGAAFRALAESGRLGSCILWGPPGSGKTTFARVVASLSAKHFVELAGHTAGVAEVREVVDGARRRLGARGEGTLLFLDEIHRFSRTQQDSLLGAVEDGLLDLVGATTEHPWYHLTGALLSRAVVWKLDPLGDAELRSVVGRGLSKEGAGAEDEAVAAICTMSDGDARIALHLVEAAGALARSRARGPDGAGGRGGAAEGATITRADVEAVRALRGGRHGRDEHYDMLSALIKSVRGSDVDAGLYWLARLLAAGEDPRLVARRLVILASEDVGMADSSALGVAVAAAGAVELVGMPEVGLNLAHAVVRLATAPKSASVTAALGRAEADATARPALAVPEHLRSSNYAGAGRGLAPVQYRYPHDDPRGWTPQQYLPDEMSGAHYYDPSSHGEEPDAMRWLAARKPSAGSAPGSSHPAGEEEG